MGYVAPWRELTSERFMTAVAFEHAVGSRWIVNVILAAALLSLLKVFNGNLVAASRLAFAMGRRGLVDARVAQVHPKNQTPSVAVICVGLSTAACMFLGDAILVPISDVGSLASAAGGGGLRRVLSNGAKPAPTPDCRCWRAGRIADDPDEGRPVVPGHFSIYEWLALGIWIVLRYSGAASNKVAPASRRLSGGRLGHPGF